MEKPFFKPEGRILTVEIEKEIQELVVRIGDK